MMNCKIIDHSQQKMFKNIVLTGMPGSGKSTVGPKLAQILNYQHYDIDHIVKDLTGMTPRDIVSSKGREFFLKTQSEAVDALPYCRAVISTGGGIVYSKDAIEKLRKNGIVFFLDVPLEVLKNREQPGRIYSAAKPSSLEEIYAERHPLYSLFSDQKIDCSDKSAEDICTQIVEIYQALNKGD